MHYFSTIWDILLDVLHVEDDDYGVTSHEITATEARLGSLLPSVLSAYHQQFGKLVRINSAHSHILPLGAIYRHQDALVFCKERQGSYFWAVEASAICHANPPVVQGSNDGDTWYPYFQYLDRFLTSVICWQSVYLLPCQARGSFTSQQLVRLHDHLTSIPCTDDGPNGHDLLAFYKDGLIACAFPSNGTIYVSCHSTDDLDTFQTDFGIPLDWL